MPILKVKEGDLQREFEFELSYQISLTTEERFKMMRERSKEILNRLIAHGYRKAFEIVKRK